MQPARRQSLGLLLVGLFIFLFLMARFWKAIHLSLR